MDDKLRGFEDQVLGDFYRDDSMIPSVTLRMLYTTSVLSLLLADAPLVTGVKQCSADVVRKRVPLKHRYKRPCKVMWALTGKKQDNGGMAEEGD
jgi:hypothetical protein